MKNIYKFRIHYWVAFILAMISFFLDVVIENGEFNVKYCLFAFGVPILLALWSILSFYIKLDTNNKKLTYRNFFFFEKEINFSQITKIYIDEMYIIKFSKALYIFYEDKETKKEKYIYFSLISILPSFQKIVEILHKEIPNAELNKHTKDLLKGKFKL